MARLEKSVYEKRRIGFPDDQIRMDMLERLVIKLAAFSISNGDLQPTDPDFQKFTANNDLMDQLEEDFPEER